MADKKLTKKELKDKCLDELQNMVGVKGLSKDEMIAIMTEKVEQKEE